MMPHFTLYILLATGMQPVKDFPILAQCEAYAERVLKADKHECYNNWGWTMPTPSVPTGGREIMRNKVKHDMEIGGESI